MEDLRRQLMRAPSPQAPAYSWFKAVVFALLAWNTVVFVSRGTFSEGLDLINSVLWIAVVAILEFQVRFPAAAARYRAWRGAIAAGLYSGLGTVALFWLWRADWFSAYDALLWLLAFVTIEINVLQVLRRRPTTARAAASRF